ncbi:MULTISPECIES: hypothetical protein [Streptomyces]|uniref:Uncharacterized protein n=1 Tax=Streptomyces milbemycinicus TaxID=476552 RepID=A0ABW8LBS5_9ACTN|nr:hypothetical protein [Streptomyces sp. NBS 14/10]KAK1184658.1 hypothetical protein B7755_045230 [Streptomyces sp. NBS 14/10]NUS85709.1 hypothetical protein [Streptomyces sp.]
MSAIDLMGGYAAYTTPDAAVAELATTRTVHDPDASAITTIIITTTLSLLTTITKGD